MFASPGEIAFYIYNYPVHWYGIIMSLSILTGLGVVCSIRKKYYQNISKDFIIDLSFYFIISGIIGARLYYVLLDHRYYMQHPQEIIALWNGGLSIHGCIVLAVIVGWVYTKFKKQNFLEVLDLFSFGLIIGQAIGRWGNFFNSEAFGSPTNLPWKLFIPLAKRPMELFSVKYYHPTFLYESIVNLFIFFVLFFILRKWPELNNGFIFFSYLILYSTGRLIIEGIRIDSIYNVASIPIAQIVSMVLIFAGVFGIIYISKQKTIQ